jgi:hypothetical protein
VKTAWLSEQKRQASEKAYADMRAKYIVMLPAPPANDGAQTTTPAPKKQVAAPSGEGR